MSIKKLYGKITEIKDLSSTAKEVKIELEDSLDFVAGNFINVFIEIDGVKERRAYSISSSDKDQKTVTLSIRINPNGKITPIFADKKMHGEKIEIMGPLGINTSNKMKQSKIFLFAFGIGAGVIKSIADHFKDDNSVEKITILTGSRNEDEIIYKDFFDDLTKNYSKIEVDYIISNPKENTLFKKGYIQDFISSFDFNNSDVYICGQEVACNSLTEKIKLLNPENCNFLIEAFH